MMLMILFAALAWYCYDFIRYPFGLFSSTTIQQFNPENTLLQSIGYGISIQHLSRAASKLTGRTDRCELLLPTRHPARRVPDGPFWAATDHVPRLHLPRYNGLHHRRRAHTPEKCVPAVCSALRDLQRYGRDGTGCGLIPVRIRVLPHSTEGALSWSGSDDGQG